MKKIISPHLEVREDWLSQLIEEPISPNMPIIDPHHHLWNAGFGRYYVCLLYTSDAAARHTV